MTRTPLRRWLAYAISVSVLSLMACKQPSVDPTPGAAASPTRDNNLALGNPSQAATSNANNYLMDKGTFVLSYNSSAGIPNWTVRFL